MSDSLTAEEAKRLLAPHGLKVRRLLGEGEFGTVWLAVCYRRTGRNIVRCKRRAVKLPKAGKTLDDAYIHTFVLSNSLLPSSLDHRSIVRCHRFIPEANALVMEYCENGSLKDYIQHNKVTEETASRWLEQVPCRCIVH